MEEDAEDKRSAGEDRDGDVLDGYRQGGEELRWFGAAHGCSNDVCLGLLALCGFQSIESKVSWFHVEDACAMTT